MKPQINCHKKQKQTQQNADESTQLSKSSSFSPFLRRNYSKNITFKKKNKSIDTKTLKNTIPINEQTKKP